MAVFEFSINLIWQNPLNAKPKAQTEQHRVLWSSPGLEHLGWDGSGFVFKFDLFLYIPTSTKAMSMLLPQTE